MFFRQEIVPKKQKNQSFRERKTKRKPLDEEGLCILFWLSEDHDDFAVLVLLCDPLLDLVALESLDKGLDCGVVLVA